MKLLRFWSARMRRIVLLATFAVLFAISIAASMVRHPTMAETDYYRTTCQTGNPDTSAQLSVLSVPPTLKAEEALGADASLEWYLGDTSMLSACLFHRSIDNVIYADSTTIDGGIYVPATAGEQWAL